MQSYLKSVLAPYADYTHCVGPTSESCTCQIFKTCNTIQTLFTEGTANHVYISIYKYIYVYNHVIQEAQGHLELDCGHQGSNPVGFGWVLEGESGHMILGSAPIVMVCRCWT